MVIDTSIVIKWIKQTNEIDSDLAYGLFEKFNRGEINLTAPDLLFYELTNYTSRQKDEVLSGCLDLIYNLLTSNIEVITPDRQVVEDSCSMAIKFGISGYDAIYLAVAQRQRTKLITADKKLLTVASDLTIPLQTTLSVNPER